LAGAVVRTFDDADHMTSEATDLGSLSYTYTKDRRRTLTVSGQPVVCYDYDDAGRLVTLREGGCAGPPAVTTTYDSAGRRAIVTLPNGVTQTYSYTARSLMHDIQYAKADATLLGDLTYTYDAAGRRTTLGGAWTRSDLPAVAAGIYDDANELSQWLTGGATAEFSYDADGNVLSDGTRSYEWDAQGRLVSVMPEPLSATFEYDALGRRVRKSVSSLTSQFVFDDLNPVQEKDADGNVRANVLAGLGIDEVIRRTTGVGGSPIVRVLLADGLGSTIALTDEGGDVQTQYRYAPFGQAGVVQGSASDSNPYQFTNRDNDANGLYYYRARYYSPTWHRFVSEDPLGLRRVLRGARSFQGSPLAQRFRYLSVPRGAAYLYAEDDPIDFSDPTGLDVSCAYVCACFGFECACFPILNNCPGFPEWPDFIPGPPLGLRVISCKDFDAKPPCIGGPENCS
jgi:RHS repeat-associated protein